MVTTFAQASGATQGLTDDERAILLELFKASPDGAVGVDAKTFRVKHPREKPLIRKLESDEFIRADGNRYILSLVALAALRTNETSNLLTDAENIYATLRAAFDENHERRVSVSSLAVDTGLGEEATRLALSYMLTCSLWVESAPVDVMNQPDAVIGVSEGIQDYENFSAVVEQLNQWRLERARQRASGNWAGFPGPNSDTTGKFRATSQGANTSMNTAGRLLQIYDRLMSFPQQPGNRSITAWGSAFELPADAANDEDVVVVCIQAFRAELGLLRKKLAAREVPEDLWNRCLSHFQAITAQATLQTDWKSIADEIKKFEYRLQFAWAAWALGDEDGGAISAEEQSALRDNLNALEASLSESDLSAPLRAFVQAQIDVIRSALRFYVIQGVRSIREALKTVAGSMTMDGRELKDEIERASDSGRAVMRAAGRVIEHTASLAKVVDKLPMLVGWTPPAEDEDK